MARRALVAMSALLSIQTTLVLAQSTRTPAPAFAQQEPTYTTGAYPPNYSQASLAATVIPADFAVTARVQAAVAERLQTDPAASSVGANVTYRNGCAPKASSFDYRDTGAIQPAKDQNPCGSCYIFAAAAAYEASWYLQNGEHVRISQQHLLDCAKAGDCSGGFHTGVFDFAKQVGFVKETDYRSYNAKAGSCDVAAGPYSAASWSTVYGKYGTPRGSAIKEALCVHGPIVAAMFSTDAFVRYKSGVFNEFPELSGDSDVNHDVLIIGWDDSKQAWLIENSWGPDWWGDKGFGWIRYQTNNIGFGAAWIDAIKIKSPHPTPREIGDVSSEAKALNNKAIDQIIAAEIAGGPNSVINNPGQILGGSNSVINNPGQILGGPNSSVRKMLKVPF